MCGIYGFNWDDKELLSRMGHSILHRGPDDVATYNDNHVSLGMRRLSIIDLKKGLYPIRNESGTLLTLFNGELYNYKEIKDELEGKGHRFVTECDAEIIPHAFEEFGPEFIARVNGMFAIVLYDTEARRLYLFRDRLGEKPVYYHYDPETRRFAYASEIKAILQLPEFKRQVNVAALNDYFTHRYTPGEETLFKGVKRLLPGHLLILDTTLTIKPYWDLQFGNNKNTLGENAQYVRYLLEESVKMRLMSDVPLGAYLSGGLDSSAIVALMAKHSDRVNTFTVSFAGTSFDEAPFARKVADALGTNHREIDVSLDAAKVLPDVVWHLDEPIADAATIPTYIMSKETKKYATVVLSGEGSDELFGGYERFRHLGFAYSLRNLPESVRRIPMRFRTDNAVFTRGSRLLAEISNSKQAYLNYYAVFDDEEKKQLYNGELRKQAGQGYNLSKYFNRSFIEGIQAIDIRERLPGNMLLKGDKMTMAASLEGRVPFLDHRLVEFAAKIPFDQKVSLFQEKIVYRQAIKGLVPPEILARRKQGFTIPTADWVKDGLGGRLMELMAENKDPFIHKEMAEKVVAAVPKSPYAKRQFWALLMFEQWYNRFGLQE